MPDTMMRPAPLAPGIHHAVDMGRYHGPCTPEPGVTGSDLKRVIPSLGGRCPAWAFARWSHNPQRIEGDSTLAMALGTAAHTLILESRATFDANYARKPDGMNFATNAGKAWRAENAGREILSAADYDLCLAMAAAIQAHPGASKLLTHGHPEATCIAKDPETGIYLKARPDWLRPGIALNLKTALSAEEEAFARQAWNLGYHVSAAVCTDAMALLGEQIAYAYVVVEKDPPHCVAIRTMRPAWIEVGRHLYRAALRTYADCISSGKWPAYGDGASDMDLPPWASAQMQRLFADQSQAPIGEAA